MDDPYFSSISFKNILKAKLFDVEEVTFVKQNGEKYVHHIARRMPTVTVIPLTPENEIIFISQYRYLFKKNNLELVAGFIDKNETPLKAAKRELKEETGITASQWEQLLVADMNASVMVSQNTIFLAKGLETGEPKPDKDEIITTCRLKIDDALQKVFTGQITTTESIIGVLLVETLLKNRIV